LQLTEILTIFVSLSETKVKKPHKNRMDLENKKRDDSARLTAEAFGCSPAYVRQLVRGDRNANTEKAKQILAHYNGIIETKQGLSKPVDLHLETSN